MRAQLNKTPIDKTVWETIYQSPILGWEALGEKAPQLTLQAMRALDLSAGNPLSITRFFEPQLDENGNPLLDDNGNPLYEYHKYSPAVYDNIIIAICMEAERLFLDKYYTEEIKNGSSFNTGGASYSIDPDDLPNVMENLSINSKAHWNSSSIDVIANTGYEPATKEDFQGIQELVDKADQDYEAMDQRVDIIEVEQVEQNERINANTASIDSIKVSARASMKWYDSPARPTYDTLTKLDMTVPNVRSNGPEYVEVIEENGTPMLVFKNNGRYVFDIKATYINYSNNDLVQITYLVRSNDGTIDDPMYVEVKKKNVPETVSLDVMIDVEDISDPTDKTQWKVVNLWEETSEVITIQDFSATLTFDTTGDTLSSVKTNKVIVGEIEEGPTNGMGTQQGININKENRIKNIELELPNMPSKEYVDNSVNAIDYARKLIDITDIHDTSSFTAPKIKLMEMGVPDNYRLAFQLAVWRYGDLSIIKFIVNEHTLRTKIKITQVITEYSNEDYWLSYTDNAIWLHTNRTDISSKYFKLHLLTQGVGSMVNIPTTFDWVESDGTELTDYPQITLENGRVRDIEAPEKNTDAANKEYVDNIVAPLQKQIKILTKEIKDLKNEKQD